MFDAQEITALQHELVARWHHQPVEAEGTGLLGLVAQQHRFNFLLWHEEDIARSPSEPDSGIARVKRNIDKYNQARNDAIEKLDDWLTGELLEARIAPAQDARQNTETFGSAIDRLSIQSLRMYHLREQADRTDATAEHIAGVLRKLAVCQQQHSDLTVGLQQLADDIWAGAKRHKTYRQFKMYNDPTLNPYIYQQPMRKAG